MNRNQSSSCKDLRVKLNETNNILDRFVYSCSHDLKAPLLSIKGLTQLVDKPKDSTSKEIFKMIDKSVCKMHNFLSSLENYVENARQEIIIEEVNLNRLVNDTIARSRARINKHQIQVSTRFNHKSNSFTDKSRLELIVTCLLDNAILFQNKPKNRFIDIDVKSNSKEIKIEICDNGEGICKEYIPKVYDMFYRCSERSEGSGLGLFLVKQAVEKLQGSIKIISTHNVGTNVKFTIPNKIK